MTDLMSAPSQRFDPYAHGLGLGGKNIWEPFLGPQMRPDNTSAAHKRSTAKFNMPEAYIGESEYLKDTLEDWMFTANQTWYTERILPWYVTDNIHVQWTQWESNPHYMGITPHQATSKVVTQKHSVRRASIVRRGIAAEFENDFVSTDLGRSRFMASLAQIARSVQETANVEVLRALIHCHRYQQSYVRKYSVVTTGDLDRWIERKWERFMAAQKEDFGLEHMNVVIDQELEQMQATANVWIMGREVYDYCSTVPEGKIFYYLGGQEAVDRINGRPGVRKAEANTMGNVRNLNPERMIKDTPVYLAKSNYVDNLGTANLLSRTTEVGVFNTMFDRNRDVNNYNAASRDIRVYSNTSDDWEVVEFRDALYNLVIWDEVTGDLAKIDHSHRKSGPQHGFQDDYLGHSPDGGKTVVNCGYIGDMSHDVLTTDFLIRAGASVWNAVCKRNPDIRRKMEDALHRVWRTQRENAVSALDTTTGNKTTRQNSQDVLVFSGEDAAYVRDFSQGLISLLGKDNHLVKKPEDVVATFFNKGLMKLQRNDKGVVTGGTPEVIEASHRDFLLSTLGSAIPDAHKATLEEIAARDSTWQERARAIKDLVVKIVNTEQGAISALPNETAVNRWYKKRETDYTAKVNSLISSSAAPGAGASSGPVEYGYILPGAKIPAGWVAVDANQQCVDPHGVCPTHISHFVGIGASHTEGAQMRERVPATGRRDASGKYAAAADAERNLFNHIEKIADSTADTLVKWCAIAYLGVRFNRDRFIKLHDAHVKVPINALLCRTHATYKTRYGIKCAANGQSGYTFFGHSNMQIEWAAAHKVGLAHYTAYLSSVVFNPRNVYVVEDLFCERYLGGMGVTFWKRSEYMKAGVNRRSKDILALPLPPNMKKMNDWKIDVRGQFYTEQRLGMVEDEKFNTPCYPGFERVQHLMGWYDPIRRQRGTDSTSYRFSSIPINYLCGQGVQFHRSGPDDEWANPIAEKSAFGEKVYPGCGKVRNGHLKYLRTPEYLGLGK